jgi:hypothetical protein
MTAMAFAIVIVPFVVILGRLLAASGRHLYLSDDLALIDLHTRRALQWRQQLGVFDHNGWNHPGPALFYLLSVPYRVLGSGAKAMFVGAALTNALAAVACVGLVRRRSTPARALWAAVWLCALAAVLAATGAGATTYSESVLGALVSPWNPMIVIFPLLLFVLLCAASVDRSGLSVVGALLVGSFVVQTDFSTVLLVTVLFAASAATWALTAYGERRRASGAPSGRVGETVPDRRVPGLRAPGRWVPGRWAPGRWERVWAGAGIVLFGVMWLPPVIQQLSNKPGNLTLIYRFFTSGQPGHSLASGVNAVAAVFGVLVIGPAEIMSTALGFAPRHLAAAAVVSVAIVLIGAIVVAAVRQRDRFAAALGILGLIGTVTMVLAATRVVGHLYGYLLIWAVVLPVTLVIGLGMLRSPLDRMRIARRTTTSTTGSPDSTYFRYALGGLGAVACLLFGLRVLSIPPLSKVSNAPVERLTSLVTPRLPAGGPVFVGDNGAGTRVTKIIDVEEFIGLVNQLDIAGYRPRVNALWKPEFGPGYIDNGKRRRVVLLSTWTPHSPLASGYVGRVGDMAVTVTGANGSTGTL